MTQYVSYCRVSTNRQGASGLGLEAQQRAVKTYVEHVAGEIIATFVEIESGATRNRPELEAALRYCRRAKAILVIAKLDRLARNVAFISSLMEAGIEFVAVDAPYANRLMLHILAAFAEHEREQISVRTKAALAAAKGRGVKLGRHGATLARQNRDRALKHALSVGPHIDDAVLEGRVSLQEMADFLNDHNVATDSGGRWHPTTVARVRSRLKIQSVAGRIASSG